MTVARAPTIVVVTTSYPTHPGDAEGHFVAAEVRKLTEGAPVTVLAPGRDRKALGRERVVSLDGGSAFGFPGALARIRRGPWRAFGAVSFVARAQAWLRREPPAHLIAHFLLPCGVPLATRGATATTTVEIVVHGSDARLFAALPARARAWVGSELARSRARLRFVSSELQELVLGGLPLTQRQDQRLRSRVEPCAVDVPSELSRAEARVLLGVAPDARLAVIVARLVPGKRVHVALEACRRLPQLRAVVVGDGPERAGLARSFPGATFVGHVERPRALTWLAAADVLVSASRLEGAPTVVREARALGTQVVCLEAGDVRRWAETDAGIHVVT
ncbi:MAG: putative glycosyltransferase [Polyangiaceae bacterium]|nr:putative glycosyltransferase [Polyangiaceae bacterium]